MALAGKDLFHYEIHLDLDVVLLITKAVFNLVKFIMGYEELPLN